MKGSPTIPTVSYITVSNACICAYSWMHVSLCCVKTDSLHFITLIMLIKSKNYNNCD